MARSRSCWTEQALPHLIPARNGLITRLATLPRPHFERFPKWACGPIFYDRSGLAATHDKEKQLTREIAPKVEDAIPGTEVLAVEFSGPERFTVYVDHVQGVDHALCERVTHVLRDYLREYSVDVSSPGLERPVRRPEHFRNAVGRRVALRTQERKSVRGEVVAAGDRSVIVQTGAESVDIPYDSIVRGNLIEGER
jgi:ribosome maturation factor RimP